MISRNYLKPKIYTLHTNHGLTESIFSRYLFSPMNYLGFLSLVFKTTSVSIQPENGVVRELITNIQGQLKVLQEKESLVAPVTMVNLQYLYQVIHQYVILADRFHFNHQVNYWVVDTRPVSASHFRQPHFDTTAPLSRDGLTPATITPVTTFQLISWYWNVFYTMLRPDWPVTLAGVHEIRRFFEWSEMKTYPAIGNFIHYESNLQGYQAFNRLGPYSGIHGVASIVHHRNTASQLAAQLFYRWLPEVKEGAAYAAALGFYHPEIPVGSGETAGLMDGDGLSWKFIRFRSPGYRNRGSGMNGFQSVLRNPIFGNSPEQTVFYETIERFLTDHYHSVQYHRGFETGFIPAIDNLRGNTGNTISIMNNFQESGLSHESIDFIFGDNNVAASPNQALVSYSPELAALDTDIYYIPMEALYPGGEAGNSGWRFPVTVQDSGHSTRRLRFEGKVANRRYFQEKYFQAFNYSYSNMTRFSAGIYARQFFLSGLSFSGEGWNGAANLSLDALPVGWGRIISFHYRDSGCISRNQPEAEGMASRAKESPPPAVTLESARVWSESGYPLAGLNPIAQIFNPDLVYLYTHFVNFRDLAMTQFLKPEFQGFFQGGPGASVKHVWDSQSLTYTKTGSYGQNPAYHPGSASGLQGSQIPNRTHAVLETGYRDLSSGQAGSHVQSNVHSTDQDHDPYGKNTSSGFVNIGQYHHTADSTAIHDQSIAHIGNQAGNQTGMNAQSGPDIIGNDYYFSSKSSLYGSDIPDQTYAVSKGRYPDLPGQTGIDEPNNVPAIDRVNGQLYESGAYQNPFPSDIEPGNHGITQNLMDGPDGTGNPGNYGVAPGYFGGGADPAYRMNPIHIAGLWFHLRRAFGDDAIRRYREKRFNGSWPEADYVWAIKKPPLENRLVSGSVTGALHYLQRYPLIMLYPAGRGIERFIRSYAELTGGMVTSTGIIPPGNSAGMDRIIQPEAVQGSIAASHIVESGRQPERDFKSGMIQRKVGLQFWIPGQPVPRLENAGKHLWVKAPQNVTLPVKDTDDSLETNILANMNRLSRYSIIKSAGYFTRKIWDQVYQRTWYEAVTGTFDLSITPSTPLMEQPVFLAEDLIFEYQHRILESEIPLARLFIEDQAEIAAPETGQVITDDGIHWNQPVEINPEILPELAQFSTNASMVREPGLPAMGKHITVSGLDFIRKTFYFQRPLQMIRTHAASPAYIGRKPKNSQEAWPDPDGLPKPPDMSLMRRDATGEWKEFAFNELEFKEVAGLDGSHETDFSRRFPEILLEFQKPKIISHTGDEVYREPETATAGIPMEKETTPGSIKPVELDIDRIVEQVYYQIEKKLKFERQRMGM